MGTHDACFTNQPILHSNYGAGAVHHLGGLDSYVVGPPHALFAIILVSDVFGFGTPNLRKIADNVAAAGYLAVVPDFFYGQPYDANNPNITKEAWLKAHNTDKGFKDAKPLIAALKRKGVSAVGAAGFCWGGKVVAKLVGTSLIKAAVLLHPSYLVVDDIYAVKHPLAILWAQNDHGLTPAQLKLFGEILSKKIDSYVKIFPGVRHGWTLRWNATDEFTIKSAEEAHTDMLNWFTKHIK